MSKKFLDLSGLSYLIGKLKERFLGKTDAAASATKLSTARNINGVAFDGTQDITVKDDTKLPLSGGTMTGTIFAANPYILRVPTNDSFVNINGDTDNGGGAYIQIFGRNHPTNPGEIKFIVNTVDSEKILRIYPDGRLTWHGSNIERENNKVAGGVTFNPSGMQVYTTSLTVDGMAAGEIKQTPNITFPKAFPSTPQVAVLPSNPNVQVAWYSFTGTYVNFQLKNTSSGALGRIVLHCIFIGGL